MKKLLLLALLLPTIAMAQNFDDDYEYRSNCSISYPHFHDANHSTCIQDDTPAANLDFKWFEFVSIAGVFGLVFYKLKNKRDE